MKYKRQQTILSIISDYDIDTQEALLDKLKEKGFDVTQATVSRDVKELRIIKVSTGKNSYKYASKDMEDPLAQEKYITILRETVISAVPAGNLAVIKTYSGMANASAAAIDVIWKKDVIGSIAGDDTIFIALETQLDARELCAEILRYLVR